MDILTAEQRRFNMSRIRGRNTKPELVVRSTLHALGYRFRLHRGDLPGRPDVVLPRWRIAVFINGCFWHHHDCRYFKMPATRQDFWQEKIRRTVERDRAANRALIDHGWRTLTIWECAIRGVDKISSEELAVAIDQFLSAKVAPFGEIRGRPS